MERKRALLATTVFLGALVVAAAWRATSSRHSSERVPATPLAEDSGQRVDSLPLLSDSPETGMVTPVASAVPWMPSGEALGSSGIDVLVTLNGARAAVGASVEISRAKGVTDRAGRVFLQVERWPVHEIVVVPREAGYEWKRINLTARAAEMDGQKTLEVCADLGRAGRALVEVSEVGGGPLSGHLVDAHYLGKEERSSKWCNRIGFTDDRGVAEFIGLAEGEWAFQVPEWRNFGRSEHEHGPNDTHTLSAGGSALVVRFEVWTRRAEVYMSGRFVDLAGEASEDGFLEDFRLEDDRKGSLLLHADGAFFLFRKEPLRVRVKQLSSNRSSRWIDLVPAARLGDVSVPW